MGAAEPFSSRVIAGLRRRAGRLLRAFKRRVAPETRDYATWLRKYDTPAATQPLQAGLLLVVVDAAAGPQALLQAIAGSDAAYVVLQSRPGQLSATALHTIAAHLEQHPRTVALYADSDFLSPEHTPGSRPKPTQRHSPQFRCAWNPDLFLAQDYFGPLRVLRRDATLAALNAMPATATPGWLSELTLRVLETAEPQQIQHLPRVLFHERRLAAAQDTPTGDTAAHRDVVQAHLARLGIAAQAQAARYGVHVRYALPAEPPLVTLIIPTRNGVALMRQCIGSILEKTRYPNYEIIVVDNGSDDPQALAYFEEIARHARIRVLRDDSPFNYSALNNRAAAQAHGELLALVNNDIEVISPDWLDEMVGHALRPGVGAVGARLWYPDDRLQHGGVILGMRGVAAHAYGPLAHDAPGYLGRAQLTQNFSAVTAACLVVQKALFNQVGGLDAENLTVAFNDIDFCLRLGEAGYRNVWTPHAQLYHHESISRGTEDTQAKRDRFAAEVHHMKERWKGVLQADPAYNPNLTLEHDDFSLAWPPRPSRTSSPNTP